MAALAAVAIGCGGGGGGKSRVGTTTGSTASNGMSVNLKSGYGRVEVAYLTGQGRSLGDTYLEITRQTISNVGLGGAANVSIDRDGIDPIELPLTIASPGNSFTSPVARLEVPFTNTNSGLLDFRSFNRLTFDPNRVLNEDSNGNLTSAGTLPSNLPLPLDARIRVFVDRTTTVPLRVSDATFAASPSGGFAFDAQLFKDLNYSTTGTDPDAVGKVAGRLSDFIRFPLTYVPPADRPDLHINAGGDSIPNGTNYVYFSGDNVALSDAAGGDGSVFQEVGDFTDNPDTTPGANPFIDFVVGRWASASSGGFQGTYDLRDNIPDLPEGSPSSIVSIYGGFRDYTQVLSGGGTFEIIMFPNSGDVYSFEPDGSGGVTGRTGDLVGIVRDGQNRITKMYYGGVDLFGDNPDTVAVEKGYFQLFPIKYLGVSPASILSSDILTGTIGNLTDRNGAATTSGSALRRFTYTFTSDVSGVSGLSSTGTVTVFRK